MTFDTGGISIKPAATMHEMKFDMSGGAAVIGAMEAIARLRLPVRIVGVVGATENMPGGNATRPGDIVTAKSGTTIEINNTDAEGRLVLADCIDYALELGAERLVDLATLTGGIVVALGSTYAGLLSNDDGWAAEVEAAATASGDLVWRLPLHPEYDDLIKGHYARHHQPLQGAAQGDLDHRGALPLALRRRHAVGAHRHRRDGLRRRPLLHGQGRLGHRRAAARGAGPARRRLVRPQTGVSQLWGPGTVWSLVRPPRERTLTPACFDAPPCSR